MHAAHQTISTLDSEAAGECVIQPDLIFLQLEDHKFVELSKEDGETECTGGGGHCGLYHLGVCGVL